MSDKAVATLRGKYPGQTLYVVGKGPSLAFLQASLFGPGPVVAINEAILVVQELQLENPIYSMQKDGNQQQMIRPKDGVTLILQKGWSSSYFRDFPDRIVIEPARDRMLRYAAAMSVRVAVELAKLMGCAGIVFVCCDSLSTDDDRTYDPRTGQSARTHAAGSYLRARPGIAAAVRGLAVEMVVPSLEAA